VKFYPRVVGEYETVRALVDGASIGRFGDGEFNIVKGGNCISQIYDKKLSEELRRVLLAKNEACLVGIPTMDTRTPKKHWLGRKDSYSKYLREGAKYHSAFITRPDSAPWIATMEYFDLIESLWAGEDVALVHCGERSLNPALMNAANSVQSILCNRRDCYAQADELFEKAVASGCKKVFLCCGPTATVLADRLSRVGLQGLDLGHIGMYWRRTNV
jgi:hypothetical protein